MAWIKMTKIHAFCVIYVFQSLLPLARGMSRQKPCWFMMFFPGKRFLSTFLDTRMECR